MGTNADNARKFSLNVQRWAANKPLATIVVFQKKVALLALKRVINMTPVDTGRARGNWQVTISQPLEAVKEVKNRVIRNKRGRFQRHWDNPLGPGSAIIAKIDKPTIVWISNNVPYITFLEDGHSKQAPMGMVRMTIAQLNMMFRGQL